MAKLVSTWSKDSSTKVGAVLVRPDKTVQSVGFNGFASKMRDNPLHYNKREEKLSRIIHAEINSLLFAQDSVKGSTLYTFPFCCCDRCSVQMIQAGVVRFVFPAPTEDALSRWGDSFQRAQQYFEETDVKFTEIGFQ
jgi:dCMP deaminase